MLRKLVISMMLSLMLVAVLLAMQAPTYAAPPLTLFNSAGSDGGNFIGARWDDEASTSTHNVAQSPAAGNVDAAVGAIWPFTTTARSGSGLQNGDFSQGTASWNATEGGFEVPGLCATGQADVSNSFSEAIGDQCFVIPGHAAQWTLAADMRVRGGDVVTVTGAFYTSADCTGAIAYAKSLTTTSTITATAPYSANFTYDTQANGIGSIKVSLKAVSSDVFLGLGAGCFDNISLASSGNQAPNTPGSPTPANSATNVATNTALVWTGGDPDAGDTVTYTVAFGAASAPPVVSSNVTTTTYNPGSLTADTRYYWAITATDGVSVTVGPTWSFTTTAGSSGGGLVNGDFSQGKTGWTDSAFLWGDPNNPTIPGNCNDGQANIGGSFGGGGVGQCISVTHATNWTLSVLMRVQSGSADTEAIASSKYYTTTDCSGNSAYAQTLTTTLQTEKVYSRAYTYNTQANNIQSILVSLAATDNTGPMGGESYGCFDNVALSSEAAKKYIYLPLVIRGN